MLAAPSLASVAGLEATPATSAGGSLRAAIDRRALELLGDLDREQDANTVRTVVRSAFGVAAEGFPFGDSAATATVHAITSVIEANLGPSPLVATLQANGSRCPLFLIHAGAGYVFFYRALASRLAPHHPVYGIRAETASDGLGHRFDRWQSIEAVATHYIGLMKAVQPEGPYAVGGGSLGGTVAFEMARQLVAAGDRVRAVLMFCPELLEGEVSPALTPKQALNYVSRKVVNGGSEALALLRRLRPVNTGATQQGAAAVPVHRQFAPEFAFRCSVNMRASARLLSGYRPGPYANPVVLFRAAHDRDPLPLLTPATSGGIELHDVPGGHLELLEEPAVESVAAVVTRHLA